MAVPGRAVGGGRWTTGALTAPGTLRPGRTGRPPPTRSRPLRPHVRAPRRPPGLPSADHTIQCHADHPVPPSTDLTSGRTRRQRCRPPTHSHTLAENGRRCGATTHGPIPLCTDLHCSPAPHASSMSTTDTGVSPSLCFLPARCFWYSKCVFCKCS